MKPGRERSPWLVWQSPEQRLLRKVALVALTAFLLGYAATALWMWAGWPTPAAPGLTLIATATWPLPASTRAAAPVWPELFCWFMVMVTVSPCA